MERLRDVLQSAEQRHVAVGHFNISDLVAFKAVVSAARQLNLPVLIGVSEGERAFVGVREVAALVRSVRDETGHPVFLNADHTHSLEKAKEAAAAGFDEVIFDASAKPFAENLAETRQAVEVLKSMRPDLLVEGEIGYIGASSQVIEKVPEESRHLSTPEEAEQFVSETKIDVLAPAVGTMHGLLASMVRGEEHKRLDIALIRKIKERTGVFMTLHGGSGTADEDFLAGIAAGLTIIHVNTELRLAWRRGVEDGLKANPSEIAPYKILPPAVDAVGKVVTNRLRLFNSLAQRSA
jgi:fructose-bisphosphate aldolase class II